jgi:hypothetical protein
MNEPETEQTVSQICEQIINQIDRNLIYDRASRLTTAVETDGRISNIWMAQELASREVRRSYAMNIEDRASYFAGVRDLLGRLVQIDTDQWPVMMIEAISQLLAKDQI